MRLVPKSLKWRAILLTLLGLVSVVVSVWFTFGRQIGWAVEDRWNVLRLRYDPHPVTRGLACGDIGPHTSVEEMIVAHPLDVLLRSGRFVRTSYYTNVSGTHVIGVNGRPACASFCALNQHTIFFDHLTRDENRAVTDMTPENGRHRPDEVRAGHRAVAGVAGYEAACTWTGVKRPDEPESDQQGK